MIRVAVSGLGQMGRVVIDAVEAEGDMELAGIITPRGESIEYRSAAGTVMQTHSEPAALFAVAQPDVVVDFTHASWTPRLVEAALTSGVRPIIGTSGIQGTTLDTLRNGCLQRQLGGVLAPNFALGAVVLMHLSKIAAEYFETAEIIELHHDRKVDSPSGTALATARMMRSAHGTDFTHRDSTLEHIPGARGAVEGGVGLHSVRLPGFVASQQVILGGPGQTLTLRHDTIGRDCYVPGINLAIRQVMLRNALVEGLDTLIGLR